MNTFDSLRSLSMTGKLLIILSTLFVGSLSCAEQRRLTTQEYQARIFQINQFASEFITAKTKKDKIKNIDDRLTILSHIVTEAVRDGAFQVVYKDGVIDKVEDIAEHNPLLGNNNQALIPFQGYRPQAEALTVKGVFAHSKLNVANLTTLFKELRALKEELSKVTYAEFVAEKYEKVMKPFFNKAAFWTSAGFMGIMASKIAYKHCLDFSDLNTQRSFIKALTLDNAAYLLGTLAIVSHYLRK